MKKIILSIVIGLMTHSTLSYAEDLMQVYNQALQSDPTFHNAIATYRDNYENLPQSVAQLLPNIVGNANTTYTRSNTTGVGFQKYNSHGYQIELTQPIINYAYWVQVQSARASVKSAFATLLAAKQDLMIRVANAYFAVLQAEDNLRFIIAQKRAVGQQLEQTQQRFKVGLDAITSVYTARAQYDAIIAQEIAAKNAINNQREVLRQITGCYYLHLAPLKANIPLLSPKPANVTDWIHAAEEHNMTLMASRFTALAAKQNIKIQFAGHLPTLNVQETYQDTDTHQPSAASANNSRQMISALQLNVPVFSGGAVISRTSQAHYQYLEAVTQMETTYRATLATTHQTFNSILSGISQILADRQAIVSRISSLNGTEAAFKVGTRTIVDVLNDQQALTQAQQQYTSDQYAYINNTLLLKQTAGQLDEGDLIKINHWLNPAAATMANYDRINLEAITWKQSGASISDEFDATKPEHSAAEKYLLGLKENRFVLQLLSDPDEDIIKKFIASNKLHDKTIYYQTQENDKLTYAVIYGDYESQQAANNAIKQLPKKIVELKPIVKSVKDIHTEILKKV